MTGSSTVNSPWIKLLAVLVAAGTVLSAGWFSPADAHTIETNWRERRHIKQRAKSQLGTPYSYGGTSSSGFDCSGFTMWTFGGHGASLPHNSLDQFRTASRPGYRRIWNRRKLRKGDLVFHKTTSARVGHVGIYTGNGKFISTTSSGGVRVRSIWDPYYWGPRWVGATRVSTLR
ncbi:MAG: C40 family peptidase [Actinomycetota bacterium]|nr:C40 family peptidase [Actinomycetota bacterium]